MAFNINEMSNNWSEFKTAVKNYFNKSVDKTGDTMTGSLVLSKNPDQDMEAANKQYVDSFWNFRPGNDYVFDSLGNWSETSSDELYVNGMEVGSLTNNDHYLQYDDVGKTFKKTIHTTISPKADGELTLNLGSNYYIYRANSFYFNSLNRYTPSETNDVIYNIKISYCVEGLDDIVLFEKSNVSAYNPSLPDLITINVPIKRNVAASIIIEYTIVELKGNGKGNRMQGTNSFLDGSSNKTFTLSMSNPLFQL